jgi:hypothetical protein
MSVFDGSSWESRTSNSWAEVQSRPGFQDLPGSRAGLDSVFLGFFEVRLSESIISLCLEVRIIETEDRPLTSLNACRLDIFRTRRGIFVCLRICCTSSNKPLLWLPKIARRCSLFHLRFWSSRRHQWLCHDGLLILLISKWDGLIFFSYSD